MVARITSPSSIFRALNYNEQKVQKGVAECLYAGNFLKDAQELNFHEKLNRFTRQNALNEKVNKNSLHISLNFAAEDQLSKEKLQEIASAYMEKIGFGEQPYLVYQHLDAGHTHLHVVTTTIQMNGKQIRTYNIGKEASEKARKELEIAYGLTKAQNRKQQLKQPDEMMPARIARYGKTETKQAIQNVLTEVISKYKYTSLAELNAVLGLYNVMADRGKETSRTYQYNGLYYRMLDDQGRKIGNPIKASAFYSKPTLAALEERFRQNAALRSTFVQSIKTTIEFEIRSSLHTLESLREALKKERITLVIRRNSEGRVYGLTYVDMKNKVVFKGSDLGKEYAAKGLTECMAQKIVARGDDHLRARLSPTPNRQLQTREGRSFSENTNNEEMLQKALELVMKPVEQYEGIDPHLFKKKPKGHSKGMHH